MLLRNKAPENCHLSHQLHVSSRAPRSMDLFFSENSHSEQNLKVMSYWADILNTMQTCEVVHASYLPHFTYIFIVKFPPNTLNSCCGVVKIGSNVVENFRPDDQDD